MLLNLLIWAGYKVGDKGCCGTGTIEVVLLCNRFTPLCPNDLEYVFWDSFHPTESVYKRLIASLIGKYLDKFLWAFYVHPSNSFFKNLVVIDICNS